MSKSTCESIKVIQLLDLAWSIAMELSNLEIILLVEPI